MPKGYIIAELTATNPGPAFEEYREKVLGTVAAFGGRFLVRGAIRSSLKAIIRKDARSL